MVSINDVYFCLRIFEIGLIIFLIYYTSTHIKKMENHMDKMDEHIEEIRK